MLKLYNTLTRKVEKFSPINPPKVGVYGCGPTVYDHVHIGNLRSFILYDTLRRVLEADGYEVQFVENITDVDDKIIKKAKEKNLSLEEFTTKYIKIFHEDLAKLNINPANIQPKATEHIEAMVKFIEVLLEKKLAYQEKDGSVYFDISKFPGYGKLSGIDKSNLKTGTRVLSREARELRSSDEYSKENVQDFALWKSVGPDDSPSASSESMSWDSPFGKGRPGWHIECSVMSQEYLGDTFDIHLGGVDLIFPHHENEIAQSEGKTGKQFVKFWVHGEHLLVDGAKMSKSLGNFYTLVDLEGKECEVDGIKFNNDPLTLRFLFLTAHYRSKLNFTWASLVAAQTGLDNLREWARTLPEPTEIDQEYWDKFLSECNNDLNISRAVAVLFETKRSLLDSGVKAATLLKMDKVLGLGLEKYLGAKKFIFPTSFNSLPTLSNVPLDQITQIKIDQRLSAKQSGNFQTSDEIREELEKQGFQIKDTSAGTVVKKK